MKEDNECLTDAGISVKELPIFGIWRDNDANNLFEEIKTFRKKNGLNPSDEVISEKIWEINQGRYNSFQTRSVIKDLPDEIIRKMRITGLFTLRGAGRYLDLNKNRSHICNYIIENYTEIQDYELHNEKDLKMFELTSKIDETFISEENFIRQNTDELQISFWAEQFRWETIKSELLNLKNRIDSRHSILKIMLL